MKINKKIYLFNKVPFNQTTKIELIDTILSGIQSSNKRKILNMNTYGVVQYLKNTKYASIIDSSDLIYPDGWGPVLAAKLMSQNLKARVNVGDFIFDLFTKLNKRGISLYLLGCEQDTIVKCALTIQSKYPNIKIVGYHNGFFNIGEENKIVKEISSLKPNLVLVGMGVPHQEYFINKNWKKLPKATYMGVGGVFYYISGLKQRAPKWIRNNGLEWVYRFFQEPSRLWRRYTIDNLYFVYNLIKFKLFKKI